MEANPKKPGVILDGIGEVIILKDALTYLMNPESREEAREAARKEKELRTGFEIVSLPPHGEEEYAAIAEAAHQLLGMEYYDEIFEALRHYEPDQIAQVQSVRYLNENEANLVKFLLGVYVEVADNELGKEQAGGMAASIDEKLAESRELIAASKE